VISDFRCSLNEICALFGIQRNVEW